MSESVIDFYDSFSKDYHLIFKDWDHSIKWHSDTVNKVIAQYMDTPRNEISLFDCSCGIGTQAIGLALLDYKVHATDLSPKAVERAQKEAERLGTKLTFGVADFLKLKEQVNGLFDVVITFDNALPHLLNDEDLLTTFKNIWDKLNNNGLFLGSIRDYDQLIIDRPQIMAPYVIDNKSERRIAFQVWDWEKDSNNYIVNQFIVTGGNHNWNTTNLSTSYRAISKKELKNLLEKTGFKDVTWHMPEETSYHQPIISAIKK